MVAGGGSWEREGSFEGSLRAGVRLSHQADTFLRDMPLLARPDTLTAERSFTGATVSIVLTKKEPGMGT